jgi:hypothetical protein
MAQLTTTKFTPTPAQARRATVRGARVPAEVRVVQATGRRVEAQIAAAQSQPTQAQAAAGGRVRRPGGEALIPLRGDYRTAGTPVGSAVSYADGQVSARPLVGGEAQPGPTTRALVIGDREPLPTDARWDSDLWLDATTQALYVWRRDLSVADDGGLWLFISGATEAFPFRLDGQEDGTYTIDPYQHYPVMVEALQGVSGATVTVSPTVGNVAEVGSAISITVSGSASGTPVLGSVLLRRVG